jgi:hypothetical protein
MVPFSGFRPERISHGAAFWSSAKDEGICPRSYAPDSLKTFKINRKDYQRLIISRRPARPIFSKMTDKLSFA